MFSGSTLARWYSIFILLSRIIHFRALFFSEFHLFLTKYQFFSKNFGITFHGLFLGAHFFDNITIFWEPLFSYCVLSWFLFFRTSYLKGSNSAYFRTILFWKIYYLRQNFFFVSPFSKIFTFWRSSFLIRLLLISLKAAIFSTFSSFYFVQV